MRDLGALIDDFCDEALDAGLHLDLVMKHVRWRMLRRALARSENSVTRAASEIGVHRNTAHRFLEEWRESQKGP